MLQQSEEEQASAAGVAAIETEGKFIEIGIQMLGCDRSLVGAEQPAFEQRSNAMNPRQGNVRRIAAAGDVDCVVLVSLFRKAVVAPLPVGANLGARLNRRRDKKNQAGS